MKIIASISLLCVPHTTNVKSNTGESTNLEDHFPQKHGKKALRQYTLNEFGWKINRVVILRCLLVTDRT
jgi:hypothetical protein